MDIPKELSWLVYQKRIAGLRHVDTDLLGGMISDLDTQLTEANSSLSDSEGALKDKAAALNDCLDVLNSDGASCQKTLQDLRTFNAQTVIERDNARSDANTAMDALTACKAGLEKPPLPQTTLDLCNAYYTKYPEANITSDAHYIGLDKKIGRAHV